MINIADYDSEQAAFNACRANKGGTLYVPGSEFNVDGLVFPHGTNIQGKWQKTAILNGTLIMPNSQGGRAENVSIESIDCVNMRDFKFDQVRFFGDTAVTLSGATYYNVFDMCKIESRIGYSVGKLCNANYIHNGRSNCKEFHVKFEDIAHGWYIHSVFEGNGRQAGSISLKGESHELHACWYERSGNNKWMPATVLLDETTKYCRVVGGSRGYLFSVIDEGSQNICEPALRLPSEYR